LTVENYLYGDDDELTEIKIGTTVVKSFGYDGAGRRTSATYSGVTTNYAYDYESRITSITRTGVTANSFACNGLDTRVSKTDSGGTTSYKRAGAYVTDSLLKSTVSSTTTDYTPGVSSRVGSDSTFLHSGLKNADTQTDDSGDVSAMRRYDAFGNPIAAWGGWQGPFGYGGPYGYQTDPDHGLMLLGHRYYEAETGRFLTRDPIKDGRNWYGYCGNDPVNSADPSGLRQSESYIQDVGQVFAGYGDAIGQFLISTTPYGQYKTWRRAMEVGPRQMLLDFVDGFKFWDAEDPREFGRRFGNGLLLIAPGLTKVPSPKIGGRGLRIAAEPPMTPNGARSFETKVRKEPGRDGGISKVHIERDASGAPISRIHEVIVDGKVVHRHQEHIGKYGEIRAFPDAWIEFPTIP